MRKAKILEFFNDINYAYNNSGMHESLSIMLNEMEKEIRNKAIDEFAGLIIELVDEFPTVEDEFGELRPMNIEEMCSAIADQMKGET